MRHLAVMLSLLCSLLVAGCARPIADPQPPSLPPPTVVDADRWQVEHVVDGDTIVVTRAGVEERVRLLGVDTPETVHPNKPVEAFGKQASEHLHALLDGATVRLEHPDGSDTRDHFDRLVAYVYRQPDDLLINLEIVRDGYGHALTEFPFDGLDQFIAAEQEAREARRGLWADAPEESGPTVVVTPTGNHYHRPDCGELGEHAEAMGLSRALAEGYEPCGLCRPPTQP